MKIVSSSEDSKQYCQIVFGRGSIISIKAEASLSWEVLTEFETKI